jgi:glutamate-1-semialdehyde 2,1-aminomutase
MNDAPTDDRNVELMERSARFIPGGITSTNRRIDRPLVFVESSGSKVTDANGRSYIDYNCAFGATILGHCHPAIAEAVSASLRTLDLVGLSATEVEGQLAQALVELIPSAEQVMFVNSGSEATYHALRLARAVTGRKFIVKFQGGYHGWYDYVAMNVITEKSRIGTRQTMSAGTLQAAAEHTIVARFNDAGALRELFQRQGHEIAAVIIEPIQHNIGAVRATGSFLHDLREVTREHNSILIFDEVITCFRHAMGGYQAICGIEPDLTTIGKAIANGVPISAVVGRRELIRRCAPPPVGDVFLAGTFNGAPFAAAAALATIEELGKPGSYERLYGLGDAMRRGLDDIFARVGITAQAGGYGSVWLPYFMKGAIDRYEDLLDNDSALDVAFRIAMIDKGCLTTPTPLKRYNFTLAHTEVDLAHTLQAAEDTLRDFGRQRHRPNQKSRTAEIVHG